MCTNGKYRPEKTISAQIAFFIFRSGYHRNSAVEIELSIEEITSLKQAFSRHLLLQAIWGTS